VPVVGQAGERNVIDDPLPRFCFPVFLLNARRGTIIQEAQAESTAGSVREVVQADIVRPIVHLPSLIDTLISRGETNRRS
jgi:hypothetical protein